MNWEINNADANMIDKIVDRATTERPNRDRLDTELDLTACHLNGCPLDLGKLLDAGGVDFWHDIHGINEHIDRQTGKLRNCFVPRCSTKGV